MFVNSEGSPYTRFKRALATDNPLLIRAAAAELPWVHLPDALAVCVAIKASKPDQFERAAIRWLGRLCLEQPALSIRELREAANALEQLPSSEASARHRGLCG